MVIVFAYMAGSMLPSSQIERATAPEWRAATYRGLTIGKSTRADMLRVLGKPLSSGPSADQAPPQPIIWNDYGTISDELSGSLAVEVDSRDNRIVSISITPTNLSKDDAIKYFGRDYLSMRYAFCKDQPDAGGLGFIYESPASGDISFIEYRAKGVAIQFDSGGIVGAIYFVAKPMGLVSEAACQKEIEKFSKNKR